MAGAIAGTAILDVPIENEGIESESTEVEPSDSNRE